MTEQEAIDYLKSMQNNPQDYAEMVCAPAFAYGYRFVYPGPEDYAIDVAVKALEKQIAEGKNGWIPCSVRLPNKDEYLKDDGRFIVTDGNRRYQSIFDIYSGKFKAIKEVSPVGWYSMVEDKCVIAWQPLPEPYEPEGE